MPRATPGLLSVLHQRPLHKHKVSPAQTHKPEAAVRRWKDGAASALSTAGFYGTEAKRLQINTGHSLFISISDLMQWKRCYYSVSVPKFPPSRRSPKPFFWDLLQPGTVFCTCCCMVAGVCVFKTEWCIHWQRTFMNYRILCCNSTKPVQLAYFKHGLWPPM